MRYISRIDLIVFHAFLIEATKVLHFSDLCNSSLFFSFVCIIRFSSEILDFLPSSLSLPSLDGCPSPAGCDIPLEDDGKENCLVDILSLSCRYFVVRAMVCLRGYKGTKKT
jgi:hypothetical protein